MQSYLKDKHKKIIKKHCEVKVKNGEKIYIKTLANMLSIDEKYAMFEIMKYIKNDLHIPVDKIFHGEANYIIKLSEKREHYQLVNDLYFNNCYWHQYVIYQELGVSMEEVQKYIIHHISQEKEDSSLENLWIFYKQAVHMAFHQALKHNPNIDIEEFTRDYVEEILDKDNAGEVQKYLEILDKLIAKKTLVKTQLCKREFI